MRPAGCSLLRAGTTMSDSSTSEHTCKDLVVMVVIVMDVQYVWPKMKKTAAVSLGLKRGFNLFCFGGNNDSFNSKC